MEASAEGLGHDWFGARQWPTDLIHRYSEPVKPLFTTRLSLSMNVCG